MDFRRKRLCFRSRCCGLFRCRFRCFLGCRLIRRILFCFGIETSGIVRPEEAECRTGVRIMDLCRVGRCLNRRAVLNNRCGDFGNTADRSARRHTLRENRAFRLCRISHIADVQRDALCITEGLQCADVAAYIVADGCRDIAGDNGFVIDFRRDRRIVEIPVDGPLE